MDSEIIRQTDAYYTEKAERFGATNKGVDWNSKESQRLRFAKLSQVIHKEQESGCSICDYGCGYGYYSEYLQENGYRCRYTGIDLSAKMISLADQKYGGSGDTVFRQDCRLDRTYDYIVASGIFNVRQNIPDQEWTDYVLGVLEDFCSHAEKGFAFNCLTSYSDAEYQKDYLYYGDPLFYFDYAKRHFARNVTLLHDYDLYEFTLLVRKQVK